MTDEYAQAADEHASTRYQTAQRVTGQSVPREPQKELNMDTNIRPINTRHEAIKAMARALADLGHTRDTDADRINANHATFAVRAMIQRYTELDDMAACFEFITEASAATDSGLMTKLTDAMLGNRDEAIALSTCLCTRARWYGELFIPEALEMLDSAGEIERDRRVDLDIDERKECAA